MYPIFEWFEEVAELGAVEAEQTLLLGPFQSAST